MSSVGGVPVVEHITELQKKGQVRPGNPSHGLSVAGGSFVSVLELQPACHLEAQWSGELGFSHQQISLERDSPI